MVNNINSDDMLEYSVLGGIANGGPFRPGTGGEGL